MRIAIFNWRDLGHPKAGGAELSTHRLAKGLAERGHEVQWFASAFEGGPRVCHRDGYKIVRRGNEITCRAHAALWLHRNKGKIDIVVDEVNTLPFFSPWITPKRVVLWMHQLAREVWLAEAPFLLGALGYFSERWMLKLYSRVPIITVSNSSAASIRGYTGTDKIAVAENALEPPIGVSQDIVPGRLTYVGRLTPSKRVGDIVRALPMIRAKFPFAHLMIVGRGNQKYVASLMRLAKQLNVSDAVRFLGRVTDSQRDTVLKSTDILLMASLREGWGLVVSEAARYAIPSVVYPVDGLIDSVVHCKTGLITDTQNCEALSSGVSELLSDRGKRDELGRNAMEYIRPYTLERFLDRFEGFLLSNAQQCES